MVQLVASCFKFPDSEERVITDSRGHRALYRYGLPLDWSTVMSSPSWCHWEHRENRHLVPKNGGSWCEKGKVSTPIDVKPKIWNSNAASDICIIQQDSLQFIFIRLPEVTYTWAIQQISFTGIRTENLLIGSEPPLPHRVPLSTQLQAKFGLCQDTKKSYPFIMKQIKDRNILIEWLAFSSLHTCWQWLILKIRLNASAFFTIITAKPLAY